MKLERREIVTAIILSIVTCGIYSIFWGVKLGKDAAKMKDPNDDGLLEVLLIIFLPFLGFYFAEKKVSEGLAARGINHDDNSLIYLILGIFGLGLVDFCLMQNEFNKLADQGFDFYATVQQPYQQPYQQPIDTNFDNNNN